MLETEQKPYINVIYCSVCGASTFYAWVPDNGTISSRADLLKELGAPEFSGKICGNDYRDCTLIDTDVENPERFFAYV